MGATDFSASLPHAILATDDETDDAVVALLDALVSIDSTDPGAYETAIAQAVYAWLAQEMALVPASLAQNVSLTSREVLPGRPNAMARIEGTEALPALVLSCHMDTVPAGAGWSHDPFSLTPDGERLYGRGSCDMKGGLACALAAFARALHDLIQRGRAPKRTIALLLSVDEEDLMRGVEAAIDDGWVEPQDWLLDLEPTDGRICTAHKGRLWIEATITGASAHASTPWEGSDAVAAAAEVICFLRDQVAALPEDAFLGATTITFGQIRGGEHPYIVPGSCTVWMDVRLVPPTDSATICRLLEQAFDRAADVVAGSRGSYRITGNRPSVRTEPDSPLLAHLLAATEQIDGKCAALGVFTGYTDTAVVAARTGNTQCLSYGPGSLALAHKPDEYVPIGDLRRVWRVVHALIRAACWQTTG